MFPNMILINLIKYCNYCLYEPTKLLYKNKSLANYNDGNKTVGILIYIIIIIIINAINLD